MTLQRVLADLVGAGVVADFRVVDSEGEESVVVDLAPVPA